MKRVICFALLLASVTATTAAQDIAFDDLEWQTFNTSGGCIAYEARMSEVPPFA